MVTQMKPPLPQPGEGSIHDYNAEAAVLSADFEEPLRENIKARAHVKLPKDGHYQFKQADPFRLDGLISYRSGYTQVAGHRSTKHAHGFTTLVTSVVEDLNVLDVITADRVVGQISTVHPVFDDGPVPSVTFLGTRFDNLRIGGHKVEVERHVDILGHKRGARECYFEDKAVLGRISDQYTNINGADELPLWAKEQYRWDEAAVRQQGNVSCSLVNRVTGAPGVSFGHVIDVPHFGRIFLAELSLDRKRAEDKDEHDAYSFHLTMIRLELGCLAHGKAKIVSMDSNGGGSQGGGGHSTGK
jgi:hypothetical protein